MCSIHPVWLEHCLPISVAGKQAVSQVLVLIAKGKEADMHNEKKTGRETGRDKHKPNKRQACRQAEMLDLSDPTQ